MPSELNQFVTPYRIALIAILIISGCCSTIVVKWSDREKFFHPIIQTMAMFLGEFLCLPIYAIYRLWRNNYHGRLCGIDRETYSNIDTTVENTRGRSNFVLFLPSAVFDFIGTSLGYIGLNLTLASSFQMLRGSVVIFTGLLSVALLGVKLGCNKWIGTGLLVVGLVLVGLADVLVEDNNADVDVDAIITGDFIIIIAQVLIACQVVYQQKYIQKYNLSPLFVVGLEGLFGLIIGGLVCLIFYLIPMPDLFTNNRAVDVIGAFDQIYQNSNIFLSVVGLVLCSTLFKCSGLGVTKELSSMTRMVVDSCRVLIIWLITISIGWQTQFTYVYVQIIGFIMLVVGAFVYSTTDRRIEMQDAIID